jgi:hypothetical protein
MFPSISAAKKQLSLTACTVSSTGTVTVDKSKSYSLVINPSEFSHERSICYNSKRALGQTGSDLKFSAVNPDKVTFSVLFDGTGVVPIPADSTAPADVEGQLDALSAVVYTYNGTTHEPNHVQLLWGTLIFYGRLQSISTQYTLFKPSGAPLRAKSSLSFSGFLSKKEGELSANRNSPDLSHLIEVRAGDTLPLLCHRIYGDSSYYLKVAQFNGLQNFRRLPPGTQLHFPPLE